jgi:hypothetical protein
MGSSNGEDENRTRSAGVQDFAWRNLMETKEFKRQNDQNIVNHVCSVFIEAQSEDPVQKPTTLFNIGDGPISHIEIVSHVGPTAKCRVYLRDRERNAEGGDNYYLEGLRAETFLQGLRNCGAWPLAAEVAVGASRGIR